MFLDFLSLQVLDTEKANFVWKRVSKTLCKLEVENKQHINSWSIRRGRMMYTTFATVPCYYHLDLFSDILTKNWATVNFSISSSIMLSTRNVRWSKIDLIVCHVSYFKFAARAIKPHFHATFVFFFFFSSIGVLLKVRKNGQHKTCNLFCIIAAK